MGHIDSAPPCEHRLFAVPESCPDRQQARGPFVNKRMLQLEGLERRDLLAGNLQNPVDFLDVNGDDVINAADAVILINDINRNGPRPLSDDDRSRGWLDVNADGELSAADPARVINYLNHPADQVQELSHLRGSLERGSTEVWVDYQIARTGPRTTLEFQLSVENGPSNARLDVQVDEQAIGQLETDSHGNGRLVLQDSAKLPRLTTNSRLELPAIGRIPIHVFSTTAVAELSGATIEALQGTEGQYGEVIHLKHGENEATHLLIYVERTSPGDYDVYADSNLLGQLHVGVNQRGEASFALANDSEFESLEVEVRGIDTVTLAVDDEGEGDDDHGIDGASDLPRSPWLGRKLLTLSFAPDGTSIASEANQLYAKLNQLGTPEQWQATIARAFQTWAVHADIEVGVVADSGDNFGIQGRTQGDPRFGDIRIGAIDLSPEVLAINVPNNNLTSGTWAGDVLFNSLGQLDDLDDLFQVALHEAGNVLGLEDSTDPNSPLFSPHQKLDLQPTANDLTALQAIYGVSTPDSEDRDDTNDSLDDATTLKNSGSLEGRIPLLAYGKLHTLADVDYYELSPHSHAQGSLTFRVETAGLSLLAPTLRVFDEEGNTLGEASGNQRLGNSVTVTIADVDEEQTYYVEVASSRHDNYALGTYAIVATFDEHVQFTRLETDAVLAQSLTQLEQEDLQKLFVSEAQSVVNEDRHTNDTRATATPLDPDPAFVGENAFREIASIEDRRDSDFYLLPAQENAGLPTLTVHVRSLAVGSLVPDVTVWDAMGQAVPTTLLVNGNGELVVQAAGISNHSSYYLQVLADEPAGPYATGNYELTAYFGLPLANTRELFSGTVDQQQPTQERALLVAQTQIFHFALEATGNAPRDRQVVWATIYDQSKQPVYRVATGPGEIRTSQSVLLRPGNYFIQVSTAAANGTLLPMSFSLTGDGDSDPTGPTLVDPSETPIYSCPNSTQGFCYPGGLVTDQTYVLVDETLMEIPTLDSDPGWTDLNSWYWVDDWLAGV